MTHPNHLQRKLLGHFQAELILNMQNKFNLTRLNMEKGGGVRFTHKDN